jgi:radical SAM superfamily enzyme YgiQ (UPF0313 family)
MKIVFATLHVRRSPQAVPLAAGCLAAALPKELRQHCRLLDLFPDDQPESMLAKILDLEPDVVALPVYAWNRAAVLRLSRELRAAGGAGLVLVAGGPEATGDPMGVLAEGQVDAVVRGEGESTFRQLILHLSQGDWPRPGAELLLASAPAPAESKGSPPVEDLAALPSPWLSGILQPTPAGGVLWEVARGCPYACDFCFEARGQRGVRHLSRQRLQAELDFFVKSGVSQVWVLDATFNAPPERGRELLQLIAARAPHIHFHLEAKAEFLDRETAQLLAKITCSVQLGLQSASAEVVKNIHRSLDLDLFVRKLHLLSAEGVTFGLDLIYGLPGDDYRGFRRSVDLALGLAPNHLDIFPLAVLPGTPLDRNRQQYGLEAQPHPPYEILHSASMSAAALERCRELAAATHIFYNAGRAVGFFAGLLRALRKKPAAFLEDFAAWAKERPAIGRQRLLTAEGWQAAEILELQEAFVDAQLQQRGRQELLPAAHDLLRYHYHYAEALLGEETPPAQAKKLRGIDFWKTPWRPAPTLRIVPFTYEILDLLEMGEVDLEQFASMFRPVGSMVIFLRRGNQVLAETLEEEFYRLLSGCDGRRTPEEIFAGSIRRQEGAEIVEFAVGEGLLVR